MHGYVRKKLRFALLLLITHKIRNKKWRLKYLKAPFFRPFSSPAKRWLLLLKEFLWNYLRRHHPPERNDVGNCVSV